MPEEITCTPKEAAQVLQICLNAQQPVCLWGAPGIGKSSVVKQVASAAGRPCLDVRLSLLDPTDLRGLPVVNGDGRVHWATPEFLPRDGNAVVFFDEMNRAPVLTQNASFQLLLDRKLGEYTLPPAVDMVAACNRETDGGGVIRMPAALANRMVHINVTTDLADWCTWAASAHIEPVVIAFLRFRPTLLHQFDTKAHAFPTPRSWEFVSRIVAQRPAKELEHALVAGAVGHGAAIEFLSFVQLWRSLPSIDAILLAPTSAPVPNDVATLYAVSSALAGRADATNFGRVLSYLDRLPEEYAVYSVKDAVQRTAILASTPEFTQWAIAHQAVL